MISRSWQSGFEIAGESFICLRQAGHRNLLVCSDEDIGRACEECGKSHECAEDMLLVNSPRVGMCDYTGGYYD